MIEENYQSLRFKKLIPKLLEKDFGIDFNHFVKNGVLNVSVHQNHGYFKAGITKNHKTKQFIIIYLNISNMVSYYALNDSRPFDTVTELYNFIKFIFKKHGLLTLDEMVVKDVIL